MLQPLDRVVFAPFKKAYRRHCTEFMTEHPGHAINKTPWPRLLNKTWQDVMKVELLKKSFEATEICPTNRHAVPATAFAPVDMLDRCVPAPQDNAEVEGGDNDNEEAEDFEPGVEVNTVMAENDDGAVMAMEEPETLVNITMEDVAGLDGLEILMEEGETAFINLNADADLHLTSHQINSAQNQEEGLQVQATHTPQIYWNTDINAIFNVSTLAPAPQSQRQNTRIITSHRVLTSEQRYNEKLAQKAEKDRKERERQERKEKRLQKKQ